MRTKRLKKISSSHGKIDQSSIDRVQRAIEEENGIIVDIQRLVETSDEEISAYGLERKHMKTTETILFFYSVAVIEED